MLALPNITIVILILNLAIIWYFMLRDSFLKSETLI